ncbi:hypothetical protein INR49_017256 [Caranx melampygus]|nr:hypothetical protein INR49_017256 [Caranx melampygus]
MPSTGLILEQIKHSPLSVDTEKMDSWNDVNADDKQQLFTSSIVKERADGLSHTKQWNASCSLHH